MEKEKRDVSYIRRDMNLNELLDDNLVTALFIAAIIIAFGGLFGIILFADSRSAKTAEQSIYLALQGEKVDNDTAVAIAKVVNDSYKENGLLTLGAMAKIKKDASNFLTYSNALLNNIDKVELIIKKAPEATDIKVDVPPWKDFWKIFGFIAWLVLGTALSLGYIAQAGSAGGADWYQYPWNRWWAYPTAFFMAPYVVLVQPFVLSAALIARITGADTADTRSSAQNVPRRSRKRSGKEIEEDKKNFQSRITLINADIGQQEKKWVDVWAKPPLIQERQNLESKIRYERLALEKLGAGIEQSQRNMAEAQAKLKELTRALEAGTPEEEKLKQGFRQVLKFPLVKAAEVVENKTIIYTDTIYIPHGLGKREIGNMAIEILFHGSYAEIVIRNLTNTSNFEGRPHPYANEYGTFCFGKLAATINHFLADGDLPAAIATILTALQSAEGDNPGRVKYWKEVKDIKWLEKYRFWKNRK